jgi:RHS repeat-associated protein
VYISDAGYAGTGNLGAGLSGSGGSYRYGFNGKENDNEVKGIGNQQDYGMRIYDPRIGKFLSADHLTKSYPWYTPYQFAGNMPIAAIDLDGLEVKVSFNYGTVSQDRTEINIVSSVDVKIQLINLSSVPDDELNLQTIALNLSNDLSDKLGGTHTAVMKIPFVFKSKDKHVIGIENAKSPKDIKDYSVTFKVGVTVDVSIVNDISKIRKDALVFAIVDNVKDEPNMDVAGLADLKGGGNVAIGEVQFFESSKVGKEGRQLSLHETLHLFGADDTYTEGSHFPGTNNNTNVMFSLSPDNKLKLTDEQIVREIWNTTIGSISYLFNPVPYKQPTSPVKTSTSEQLIKFVKENGSAAKINGTP